MSRPSNLLDEALKLEREDGITCFPWSLLLVEDCVESGGAFVLHHLIRRLLVSNGSSAIIFIAFSNPFSHYERVLRKMGCNLAVQADNNRFFFIDMFEFPGENSDDIHPAGRGFIAIYERIRNIVETGLASEGKRKEFAIMLDDVSLMEVAANGSANEVLDFLHYCNTLVSQPGRSLIVLNHRDIYLEGEKPVLRLQMEYLADVLIKVEPLATGLASDVHGQVRLLSWEESRKSKRVSPSFRAERNSFSCSMSLQLTVIRSRPWNSTRTFRFRINESGTDYFCPGGRS